MKTECTNLLLLTVSAFWSSSRWPRASSRRQRSNPLGGPYRQVSLYWTCNEDRGSLWAFCYATKFVSFSYIKRKYQLPLDCSVPWQQRIRNFIYNILGVTLFRCLKYILITDTFSYLYMHFPQQCPSNSVAQVLLLLKASWLVLTDTVSLIRQLPMCVNDNKYDWRDIANPGSVPRRFIILLIIGCHSLDYDGALPIVCHREITYPPVRHLHINHGPLLTYRTVLCKTN